MNTLKRIIALFPFSLIASQWTYAQSDQDFYSIIESVSVDRIKDDIATLANFGTRHTLSDTLSNERGIGAARRWIFTTFPRH